MTFDPESARNPTPGQIAYEAYWHVRQIPTIRDWIDLPYYQQFAWDAAAQAAQSDVLRYVRAVIRHWNEFGPGYGFVEHMNALETWIEAQKAIPDD